MIKNFEIHKHISRLESLYKRFEEEQVTNPEIGAQLARYFAILVSGLVEQSFRTLLYEFSKSQNPRIVRFVNLRIKRIMNTGTERLASILSAFDTDWGVKLKHFLDANGRGEAVDSIINVRNSVSHGQDLGITLRRAKDYMSKCIEVLEFIEKLLMP